MKQENIHLVQIPQKYYEKIKKVSLKSAKDILKILDYKKDFDIIIRPADEGAPKLLKGVSGFTIPKHNYIIIDVEFDSKYFDKNSLDTYLPSAIYHEVSHIVTRKHYKIKSVDLSVRIVEEGIASYIEDKFFPKKMIQNQKIKNEHIYWKKAKKLLNKNMHWADREKWFFSYDKKLPNNIGYRLGYMLIKTYMDLYPETKMKDLVKIQPKQILKKAEKQLEITLGA